ncbi:MAG: porin family protein [Gammaproteobacteria bacterium]
MKSLARIAAAGVLVLAPVFAFAAGPWTGMYVGIQAGINSVSADGLSTEQGMTAGAFGGYNFQLADHFVLGGDAFWDWNQSKSHNVNGSNRKVDTGTNVYGVDVLAGVPLGQDGSWMPFAKVGYGWADPTGDMSGGTQDAMRYGAGIAWRLSDSLSLFGQYMYQDFGSNIGNYTNNNFTVGASLHF